MKYYIGTWDDCFLLLDNDDDEFDATWFDTDESPDKIITSPPVIYVEATSFAVFFDDEELTLDEDETTGVVAVVSIVSEEPVTRRYLLSLPVLEVEFDELLFEDINVEFEATGLDTVFVTLVGVEVGAVEILITVEVDWITWMVPLLSLLSFFTFG